MSHTVHRSVDLWSYTVTRLGASLDLHVRVTVHSFIHLLYMKPTDNHDVEDKNIISVVGSFAIAGQISLLSNAIKLHKNKM